MSYFEIRARLASLWCRELKFMLPGAGRRGTQTSPLCVVDGVSEAWCVYDAESQFDTFLLNANGVIEDAHCFIDPLCRHTHTQLQCK